MNNKEKDELNRWCHKFMGYCLSRSEDCGCTPRDYTESLDLASIVEAKAIERERSAYFRELEKLCDYDEESCITASAETRCKAARAAVEGEA